MNGLLSQHVLLPMHAPRAMFQFSHCFENHHFFRFFSPHQVIGHFLVLFRCFFLLLLTGVFVSSTGSFVWHGSYGACSKPLPSVCKTDVPSGQRNWPSGCKKWVTGCVYPLLVCSYLQHLWWENFQFQMLLPTLHTQVCGLWPLLKSKATVTEFRHFPFCQVYTPF